MDPNANVNDLINALDTGDWATARERAQDLLGWLRRGGFAPSGDHLNRLQYALERAKGCPKRTATLVVEIVQTTADVT